MGSPLSPLLANVFLHRLDQALENLGYEMVRYADDFLVFAATQLQIQRAYREVDAELAKLRLAYEPAKTRLTSFAKGFNFIGVWFQGDVYEYTWLGKRVEVHGDEVDWLFSRYGPEYD
jgi:CRISPR-associated protein Cas1